MTLQLAACAQTCAPVHCDLLSLWRAEGDAVDSAGTNNGALRNGVGFATGEAGQAFSFDGVSSYVEVSSSPLFNPGGSFSLDAWIYPLPQGAGRVLMGKWGDQGDYLNQRSYVFYLNASGALGFGIADAAHQGDGAFHTFEATASPVALSTWTHVGAVYNQATGTRQIYVNGVKVAERTDAPIMVLSTTTKFGIGARLSTSSQAVDFFSGRIDEACVYTRALSAAEMQAIYNAGSFSKCVVPSPPLILAQPQSRTVNLGGTTVLTVQADCDFYSYQWHFNGTDLTGATASSLTLTPAQAANAGTYSVTVSNAAGSVASSNASVIVTSNALCTAAPPGLVGWWAAEGAANDSAGANNGILKGGAGFGSGQVGQAFSFDGLSGFVEVPDAPNLNFGPTSPLTVELWAYRTGTQASMQLLGKRVPGCGDFEYQLADDANNGGLQFAGASFGGISGQVKTGLELPANAWVHLAVTFDGGAFRFYINGILAATAAGQLGPANSAPLTIGTASGCPPFAGLLDEVCLYSRALSAGEVQSIYLAGSKGKCYAPAPPAFFSEPRSQAIPLNWNATFRALSGGSAPLGYRWRFGGADLAGATDSSLVITNVQISNAGAYSVVVSNSLGSIASSNAVMTIASPPLCFGPPPGLVGRWAAEGDPSDSVTGNSGFVLGGVGFVPGKVGQAFAFNGVDGSVRIPDAPQLNFASTAPMTVELWAFQTGPQTTMQIMGKRQLNCGNFEYQMAVDPANGGLQFGGFGGFNFSGVKTGLLLPTNTWVHLTATFDGGAFRFYTNGVLVATASGSLGPINDSALTVGTAGNCPPFAGLLDEVCLYSRALSAEEILGLYEAGEKGKCNGPTPAEIFSQPQSQTVIAGRDTSLNVVGGGSLPLSYQWRFNGGNLPGATKSLLVVTNVQTSNSGTYSVTVANALGSTSSSNALLIVNLPMCASTSSNLVGWWAGESNGDDNLGVHSGTLQGGAAFGSGKVGQAFSFNGTDGSLQIADAPDLNFGPASPLTAELWAYQTGSQGLMHLLGKRSGCFGTSTFEYQMAIDPNGGGLQFGGSGSGGVTTGLLLPMNTWTHLCATFDGTNFLFYTNGMLVASGTGTLGPTNNAPLTIGTSGSCRPFAGLLDEILLYRRALSAAEIQASYDAGIRGKCPLPPAFVVQPRGQIVEPGATVTFTAGTMGSNPFGYQWRLNGLDLPWATNSSLTLSNVQPSDAGLYSLRITNAAGSVTSSNALLKVTVVYAFGNGDLLTNAQIAFGISATIQLRNVYTNGDLFYTLDGTTPTYESFQYTGPFTISNSVILRALGYSVDFFEYGELDPIAVLIEPNYTLSYSTSGGGVVSANPTNIIYPGQSVVTLTAAPASGWTFLLWLGDAVGTNPTNTVLMTRNKSVQAIFGTALSTTAAGGGSVLLNPPGGLYAYGAAVQLSAVPEPGKVFAVWGNAASGNLNPLSFLVTNASPMVSSLFASLGTNQVALAVVPVGHGQIAVSPRSNYFTLGHNVTITATADAQQSFLGWSGDAAGSQNPLTVAMNQSKTIYANFTKNYRFSFQPLGGLGLSDGFRLNLVGEVGTAYRFEASSNFAAWTALATLTNYSGTLEYIDAGASGFVRRFYRAVPVP